MIIGFGGVDKKRESAWNILVKLGILVQQQQKKKGKSVCRSEMHWVTWQYVWRIPSAVCNSSSQAPLYVQLLRRKIGSESSSVFLYEMKRVHVGNWQMKWNEMNNTFTSNRERKKVSFPFCLSIVCHWSKCYSSSCTQYFSHSFV